MVLTPFFDGLRTFFFCFLFRIVGEGLPDRDKEVLPVSEKKFKNQSAVV